MFEDLIVVGLKKRVVHTLSYFHLNEWTDGQLALALDVSEKTIREWRKEDAEIR